MRAPRARPEAREKGAPATGARYAFSTTFDPAQMVRSIQRKGAPMAECTEHLMLEQVQPGMVLAEELLDVQGHVLLPQGTALTAAMLTLMPRHGIEILPIVVSGVSEQELALKREQHKKRIAHLFRRQDPENEADWATLLLRSHVEDFRLNEERVE
jgi:hypothetical protein